MNRMIVLLLAMLLGMSEVTYADGTTRRDDLPSDVLEAFVPSVDRNSRQRDHVESAALFARARMQFQRQKFPVALKNFQRAHRLHPESVAILREIVPLAFQVQRHDQAARYAVLLSEADPTNPVLLANLATHLTSTGQLKRAAAMHEHVLRLHGDKKDAATVRNNLKLGRLYFLTRQYKKSAALFDIVREADRSPDDYGLNNRQLRKILGTRNVTYRVMGEAYFEAQQWDKAIEAFRDSNRAKKDDPMLAVNTARVEFRRDNSDAALVELNKYFGAETSSAGDEPYRLLAEILTKQYKDQAEEKILARIEKLHQADSENGPLSHYLASLYFEARRFDKASPLLQTLRKKQPSFDVYQTLVAIYIAQDDDQQLLDILAESVPSFLATSSSQQTVWQSLARDGEPLTKNGPLVGRLLGMIDKRLQSRKESDDLSGIALVGALLALDAKKPARADALFVAGMSGVAKEEQAQWTLLWGTELFRSEYYELGAKVYGRAIEQKLSPSANAGFHYYRSGALELAGKTDEALKSAHESAKASKNLDFQARPAWILYHAGRLEEAKKLYLGIVRRNDDDYVTAGARQVIREARMILSNICVRQKQMTEAEAWLEDILDEFPEDIGAFNDLGYLWADQSKHLERALAMVSRAVAAEPDNFAYRDSLGWALFRLGRNEDAIRELEKASSVEEPDGVVLEHLGDVYFKINDVERAIGTWKRAIETLDKTEDRATIETLQAKIEKNSAASADSGK